MLVLLQQLSNCLTTSSLSSLSPPPFPPPPPPPPSMLVVFDVIRIFCLQNSFAMCMGYLVEWTSAVKLAGSSPALQIVVLIFLDFRQHHVRMSMSTLLHSERLSIFQIMVIVLLTCYLCTESSCYYESGNNKLLYDKFHVEKFL